MPNFGSNSNNININNNNIIEDDAGGGGGDSNDYNNFGKASKLRDEELTDYFMVTTTYWIIAFMISFVLFLVFCCKALTNYIAIRDLKRRQQHEKRG